MTESITVKGLTLGAGRPKICVPMTGEDLQTLLSEAAALAAAGADLAEWRADFFCDIFDTKKVEETLASLRKTLGSLPLIFTIRTKEEGGNLSLSAADYRRILQSAAQSGSADLIDVEYFPDERARKTLIADLRTQGIRVIASSHNFERTPPKKELLKLLQRLDRSGADLLKLAVMPHTLFDVWNLLEATNAASTEHTKKPLITMAMGELGALSRFSGELFGSAVTFGTVGAASAPGQLPVRKLKEMLELFQPKIAAEKAVD